MAIMACFFESKCVRMLVLVFFVVSTRKIGKAHEHHAFTRHLTACSKAKEGNRTLYRKVSGDDGVAICLKNSGQYQWKFMDGTSTLGERFDPAKDCSDIVDNLPDAKDGFFWIKRAEGQVSKGYCDTHTDDGGYLLIGMKDSPVTWNVSTNQSPVHPTRYPHWSSNFGDVKVQDFAIQISTTKNFEDTKAHWSYRLKESRLLGNLFGIGSGGCTDFHSGIGNVSYIKDILTDTVVTKRFNCSKFGPDVIFGWERMNYCLRNQCPDGYAYRKELVNFKLDSHGSFSYSASSEFSGITHHSTAFVGCDSHKCCACFGPKGGRGHYCGRKCEVINEGTLLTGQVYVWYWIRTRTPKRLWKRCMEFKIKTPTGKYETYHIDRITNTARKGKCSGHFGTFLNEGTLLVNDRESLKNLPAIPGLISFQKDNKKLYVNKENEWSEIGDAKVTENLTAQVRDLQKEFENKNFLQEIKTKKLEARLRTLDAKLKKVENETETYMFYGSKFNPAKSCRYILKRNNNALTGVYWIQLTPVKLFQVYCDMETNGGGWTLVYSYTFTNYGDFTSGSNAVTPRPSWPASRANVPISTTPPLNESSRGAVDWNLWKRIGQEVMVKSNINDWIVCKPNVGSLVIKKSGSMNCQNIKNVATACNGVAPTRVWWGSVGPDFSGPNTYYWFDGYTRSNWPVHSPCSGINGVDDHKKGVSNPGGQIYLR